MLGVKGAGAPRNGMRDLTPHLRRLEERGSLRKPASGRKLGAV
ncbi:MAG: hypothetical protein ACM3MK_04470 [Chitinophagales bacterium]